MKTQRDYSIVPLVALIALVLSSTKHYAQIMYIGMNTGDVIKYDSTGAQIGQAASYGRFGAGGALAFDRLGVWGGDGQKRNFLCVVQEGGLSHFVEGGTGWGYMPLYEGPHMGVTYNHTGDRVYVSRTWDSRIIKAWTWPLEAFADYTSGLKYPMGLASDVSDNIYAANWLGQDDQGQSFGGTILKYAPDGSWSQFASGLDRPFGLAFDSQGTLYASDSGNNTIMKYTPDGVGSLFATVDSPKGLAVDNSDNVYIIDRYGIGKYSAAGAHLEHLAAGDYWQVNGHMEYIAFQPVPEPASALAIGMALAGVCLYRLRKR